MTPACTIPGWTGVAASAASARTWRKNGIGGCGAIVSLISRYQNIKSSCCGWPEILNQKACNHKAQKADNNYGIITPFWKIMGAVVIG